MKLSKEQKDLLIGTLLGQATLRTENSGRTWCYYALHKAQQLEYLNYKYELLKNFSSATPQSSLVFDNRTGKYYERCYFYTNAHNAFRFYGNLFYIYDNEKKAFIKQIPLNIEKYLTPGALAYWYMDDGVLKWVGKSNAIRLCTESYSLIEVNRLRSCLKHLYSIKTQLIRKNSKGLTIGYRIGINEANSRIFRMLIDDYLVDSMYYKVPEGF